MIRKNQHLLFTQALTSWQQPAPENTALAPFVGQPSLLLSVFSDHFAHVLVVGVVTEYQEKKRFYDDKLTALLEALFPGLTSCMWLLVANSVS